jgi:hypothetical protein
MADEQQQPGAISAAFPAPPPFYKHFTEQNLSRLRELQQQQAQPNPPTADPTTTSSPPTKPLDLPPELRFLTPPAPPTSGLYRSFGDSYNASPPPRPRPPPFPHPHPPLLTSPLTHRSPHPSQLSQIKASRNSTPHTHQPPHHSQPPPPPPPQPRDGRSTTPSTYANSPSRYYSTSWS